MWIFWLFFQLVSSSGQQREEPENGGWEVRSTRDFVGQSLTDLPFPDLQPKLNTLEEEAAKGRIRLSWKHGSFKLDCFRANAEVYGIDGPADLDLRATSKLTQSTRQFKGHQTPSVNTQCTRGSVRGLQGPLNWSSYCPRYENRREDILGWEREGSRRNGCRKGNGRIGWSFCISAIPHKLFLCCLIGGCCRAIWGKLAHIQITQGKLFI